MCWLLRIRKDNRRLGDKRSCKSDSLSKVYLEGNERFRNSIVVISCLVSRVSLKSTSWNIVEKRKGYIKRIRVRIIPYHPIFMQDENLKKKDSREGIYEKGQEKEKNRQRLRQRRVVDIKDFVTCVKNEPRSCDLSAVLLLQSTQTSYKV